MKKATKMKIAGAIATGMGGMGGAAAIAGVIAARNKVGKKLVGGIHC